MLKRPLGHGPPYGQYPPPLVVEENRAGRNVRPFVLYRKSTPIDQAKSRESKGKRGLMNLLKSLRGFDGYASGLPSG